MLARQFVPLVFQKWTRTGNIVSYSTGLIFFNPLKKNHHESIFFKLKPWGGSIKPRQNKIGNMYRAGFNQTGGSQKIYFPK